MKISKSRPAYFLFLFLVTFGALEVYARLRYERSYLAANIRLDRVYHHLLPPRTEGTMKSEGDFEDTYLTNNRGLRGPGDYDYVKPEGAFRIAVMGDSFTFGVGVKAEQTYSAVLQDLLEREAPGRYEVLNFGLSSYSPVLELVYLERQGLLYKPDLLVLALDPGDVQDDYFYEKNLVFDEKGRIIACDPYTRNGRPNVWMRVRQRSMLLTMVDEKFFQSLRKIRTIGVVRYFRNKFKGVRNKTAIFTDPALDSVEFDRFIFSREGKDPRIVTRHWQRTGGYLAKIKELCDQNGIRFVLAAYPLGQDVGENQWAKGREYWGFKAGKVYDPSFAFSLVERFARENGVEFVSLLEPMRQNKHKTLYYNNDGHWTADGHALAAGALFSRVMERAA